MTMSGRLRDYCLSAQSAGDTFVGLRFDEHGPRVVFPRGFPIADDDRECRKDILALLAVLRRFPDRQEGETTRRGVVNPTDFPLFSYLYVIRHFLSHGYYVEREMRFNRAPRGKISWKRTIQQEKPMMSNGCPVYLNFRVISQKINDRSLITGIHKYCVYKSFQLLGWLYPPIDALPEKPKLAYNRRLFTNALRSALNNTYNDSKRELFRCMLNIVESNPDMYDSHDRSIGVNRFEYVWEKLVEHVFGIGTAEKENFLPTATWHMLTSKAEVFKPTSLRPDTIMLHEGDVYVLDAKYYKYGYTRRPEHLPGASDIQKQITYGKYIKERFPAYNHVYNSFIMPFQGDGKLLSLAAVSVGTADWEQYNYLAPEYLYVLGVLADTKWLISGYARISESAVQLLSETIVKTLHQYREPEAVSDAH